MKKILILGISLVMLASCSNNKKPADITKLENEAKAIEKSVDELKLLPQQKFSMSNRVM
jgi:hypothetical protein